MKYNKDTMDVEEFKAVHLPQYLTATLLFVWIQT